MNKTKHSLVSQMFQSRFSLIWIIFLIFLFFSYVSPVFRSQQNLLEIFRQTGIRSILFLGLTWVVASGEIDLSFAEVAAFSSVLNAYLVQIGFPMGLSILLAFVFGVGFGVLNGLLVGYLKYPGLITTIAVGGIAKAIANTLGRGMPIYINVSPTVYGLVYGYVFGIPVLFLLALGIYLVFRFLQDQTTVGQYLYALGENRKAAQEAGIAGKRMVFQVFILSGILASLGGILLTASLSSGQPEIGFSFLLDGLTAVFLGALIIKIGKPNVLGTFISVVLLTLLVNGITLLGLPMYVVEVIKGAMLVLGVIIVNISAIRQRKLTMGSL